MHLCAVMCVGPVSLLPLLQLCLPVGQQLRGGVVPHCLRYRWKVEERDRTVDL